MENLVPFKGMTRIAYKVSLDGERFILKTSHMKEDFVRIHNLTEEEVKSLGLYDKGTYRSSTYIKEYAMLKRYKSLGILVVEGFYPDSTFTRMLVENAHPLEARFIEYPGAKQSLQMVGSLATFFQVHKLHGLGHDMSVPQTACTQDWR